jgi:hypothetical protein
LVGRIIEGFEWEIHSNNHPNSSHYLFINLVCPEYLRIHIFQSPVLWLIIGDVLLLWIPQSEFVEMKV